MERNRALSNAFAFACNRLTTDDLFDRLRWRCLCAEPLRTTSRWVTKRSTSSSRAGWICPTIWPAQRSRSISQLFRTMAEVTLFSGWTMRRGNLRAPAPTRPSRKITETGGFRSRPARPNSGSMSSTDADCCQWMTGERGDVEPHTEGVGADDVTHRWAVLAQESLQQLRSLPRRFRRRPCPRSRCRVRDKHARLCQGPL